MFGRSKLEGSHSSIASLIDKGYLVPIKGCDAKTSLVFRRRSTRALLSAIAEVLDHKVNNTEVLRL